MKFRIQEAPHSPIYLPSLLVIAVFSVGAVAVETVDVPLDRTVTHSYIHVDLFGMVLVAAVNSASVRFVGTGAPALLRCDDFIVPDP